MSKKKAQEFYSTIDEIADKEAFLESVREGFSEIEDPRTQDNQSFLLRLSRPTGGRARSSLLEFLVNRCCIP